MASEDPLLPLDKVFSIYPIHKTNFDGMHYDGMSAQQVYEHCKPILSSYLQNYIVSDVRHPGKLAGGNSLVFLAHLKNKSTLFREECDVAIKLFIPMKSAKELLTDELLGKISEQGICPKILLNETNDFGNDTYIASVLISELVIPLELYQFKSLDEVKTAITSFVDIIYKLHKLGLVHLDIKRLNICVGKNGVIYLIDFDNCYRINTGSCDLDQSSSSCYPPIQMQKRFIRLKLGDMAIDWFSTIYSILGYILNMKWWQFDDGVYDMDTDTYEYARMDEKQGKTLGLNRFKLYTHIQHEMGGLFPQNPISMWDPFWTKFCDLVFLIFKGNRKCTNRTMFEEELEQLIQELH